MTDEENEIEQVDEENEMDIEQIKDSAVGRFWAKVPDREKFLIAFLLMFLIIAWLSARRHDLAAAQYNQCIDELNLLKNGTQILFGF